MSQKVPGISASRLRKNVGYARPLAVSLMRPALLLGGIRVASEAVRSFFYPQFENALLGLRPVVNVDHPLDATIPFDHRYMKKYLEFIQLWTASFYKLWRLYGEEALPEMRTFLDEIRSLYADAGKVYGHVHSTTTRPTKNYNLRFAIIHAVDPHLDCVPSLHVLLVVGNWLLVKEIVRRLGPYKGEGLGRGAPELWARSLRDEAIAITESVLFVKQHSVNCIGASLYLIKRRFPGFGDEEARAFVRDLFVSSPPIKVEEIRGVMLDVCADLDSSYARHPEAGWMSPLLDFIQGFKSA